MQMQLFDISTFFKFCAFVIVSVNEARERTKKRLAFTANPYKFARNLLDKERSGTLETPVEEVERYLHETHSDHVEKSS